LSARIQSEAKLALILLDSSIPRKRQAEGRKLTADSQKL
jgi:hypothetical protein